MLEKMVRLSAGDEDNDDDDQDDGRIDDNECVPLKHLALCLIAGSLLEGDQLYPEDEHRI